MGCVPDRRLNCAWGTCLTSNRFNGKVLGIAGFFALGLLAVGALRFAQFASDDPPDIAGYASPLYIGLSILVAVLLVRAGTPLRRLGFGSPFRLWQFLALAVAGVAIMQGAGWLLEPLWQTLFGGGRDLERFADVGASPGELFQLLALSWTFAAFGEELAFRILLLRGIAYGLGDTRVAFGVALVAQAIVFGLVHAYQGPAGIAGTAINGLVYGGLVLIARGSIWPAALAHGLSNTIGILELYWAS